MILSPRPNALPPSSQASLSAIKLRLDGGFWGHKMQQSVAPGRFVAWCAGFFAPIFFVILQRKRIKTLGAR
jgi:hypothetical protein